MKDAQKSTLIIEQKDGILLPGRYQDASTIEYDHGSWQSRHDTPKSNYCMTVSLISSDVIWERATSLDFGRWQCKSPFFLLCWMQKDDLWIYNKSIIWRESDCGLQVVMALVQWKDNIVIRRWLQQNVPVFDKRVGQAMAISKCNYVSSSKYSMCRPPTCMGIVSIRGCIFDAWMDCIYILLDGFVKSSTTFCCAVSLIC
jgi:hypothetical protein